MQLVRAISRSGYPGLPGGLLIVALLACRGLAQEDISRLYRETCDRLMCQCGCNEQLSVCAMQNCSSATPMRAEIRERLRKGEKPEEIVGSFVARYGKKVLSAPTTRGFDLSAWVMPFVILSLGLMLVLWIALRMARPAPAAAEEAAALLDPRVEEELREFEKES
jgi:cytochrome c-type biogenesis protein CcmH